MFCFDFCYVNGEWSPGGLHFFACSTRLGWILARADLEAVDVLLQFDDGEGFP